MGWKEWGIFIGVLVVWVVFFLTAAGLFLGVMLKRTTTAMVTQVGLVVAIWLIPPLLLGVTTRGRVGRAGHDSPAMFLLCANPVYQAGVVTVGATQDIEYPPDLGEYDYYDHYVWPDMRRPFWDSFAVLLVNSAVMMLAGLALVIAAGYSLRKRVF